MPDAWRNELATQVDTWRRRITGPIVLLAIILGLEVMGRTPLRAPSPTAFLLLAVVYSAFADPRWKAYLVTVASVAYMAIHLSEPGVLFVYTGDARARVLTMAVAAPVMAWMTSALKERVEALARETEARAAAERERDFVRRVLDSSPMPILVLDPQSARVEYASLAAARTMGRDLQDIEGRSVRDVLRDAADAATALAERVRTTGEPAHEREVAYQPLHGPARYLDLAAGPLVGRGAVVIAIIDVTERRKAEHDASEARRQALQSEKLAALGTLVSGVAHEIRSPLTVAQNHVSLASEAVARKTAKESELAAHLAGIQESLDRVNSMVGELRRFSRAEVGVRTRESLAPSVQHALRLFQIAQRNKVQVEARIEETPEVELDRGQIEQVVLNLLENAAAASATGGIVEIEVGPHQGGARLVVRDHGVGMEPSVRSRIFEPFFTTKPDGTGLGLSIVRRIIEAHGGRITCESAPGRGSTFHVELPPPSPARKVPVAQVA